MGSVRSTSPGKDLIRLPCWVSTRGLSRCRENILSYYYYTTPSPFHIHWTRTCRQQSLSTPPSPTTHPHIYPCTSPPLPPSPPPPTNTHMHSLPPHTPTHIHLLPPPQSPSPLTHTHTRTHAKSDEKSLKMHLRREKPILTCCMVNPFSALFLDQIHHFPTEEQVL